MSSEPPRDPTGLERGVIVALKVLGVLLLVLLIGGGILLGTCTFMLRGTR
jgi:hypothetical protein